MRVSVSTVAPITALRSIIVDLRPACLVFAIAVSSTAAQPADSCLLNDVRIIQAPVVENGRMSYQMDLVFNTAPANFLNYYDPGRRAIIIDIYGTALVSRLKSTPRTLVFKGVKIENTSSSMSLTGERSLIIIGSDAGWQVSTVPLDSTTLRLSVSRILSVQSPAKSRFPWHWIILGAANALAAAASWGVISVLPQSPR